MHQNDGEKILGSINLKEKEKRVFALPDAGDDTHSIATPRDISVRTAEETDN